MASNNDGMLSIHEIAFRNLGAEMRNATARQIAENPEQRFIYIEVQSKEMRLMMSDPTADSQDLLRHLADDEFNYFMHFAPDLLDVWSVHPWPHQAQIMKLARSLFVTLLGYQRRDRRLRHMTCDHCKLMRRSGRAFRDCISLINSPSKACSNCIIYECQNACSLPCRYRKDF